MYTELSRDKQIIAAEENSFEKVFWTNKLAGGNLITHFPAGRAGNRGDTSSFEMKTSRIDGLLYQELSKLSGGSDQKLHIILAAAVAALLTRYVDEGSPGKDVLIVAPVYRPENVGEFINTLLPLRIPQEPGMTFREMLKGTSRVMMETLEHQNYPVGLLFKFFNGQNQEAGIANPQIAVLLENIHEPDHILCMNPAVIFSFYHHQECIDGKLKYNNTIYREDQVEAALEYLLKLLENVVSNLETPLSNFNIVPEETKKKLPGIDEEQETRKTAAGPSKLNAVEEKLAGIWSEVLEIDKNEIEPDANFFQLNGNSLRTIMLISRLFKEFEVRVPLADVFKYPTIRELARYLHGAVGSKYKSIEKAVEKEYYVLSSAQKRLFFLQQWDEKSDAYNVPDIVNWKFPLDMERLKKVVRSMIDRHESFRTAFELVNDQPLQKILSPHEIEINIDYFEAGKDEMDRIMKNFVRPFDLRRPPLLRVGAVQVDERQYLILDIHHIVTDAFSKNIFFNDFLKLYEGEELPPLKIQYKDYAEWQNSESQKEVMRRQEKYWLDRFSGDLPAFRLPTDFERPPISTFEGSTVSFRMAPEELAAIYRLAQSESVTIFMVLLGIYTVMLAKITGQDDVTIGTVVAGRSHADLEQIVGMFVNTLALRNFIFPERTFSDYLNDVKINTLEAFENQDFQFEDFVEKLNLERDASRHALFDVLLVVGNIDLRTKEKGQETLPAIKQKVVGYQNKTSKFDMTLFFHEEIEIFEWEYSTRLFKEETIKEFIDYFKEVASAVVRSPHIKIKDIHITHRLKESSAELFPMEFEF